MPTASSIPGWAGYASYMQGQQRGTTAPSMNYRGVSTAKTSSVGRPGIGPVDPDDPSNPLNQLPTGGFNSPHPGMPYNPGPVVNIPTFTGGPGQTAPGGEYTYGYTPYGGGSATMYPTFFNSQGFPHAQPVQGNWTPSGGYNPFGAPIGGGGGDGGYGGGGGMMSFRPGDVTGGRDAMSGSGKRWWERIPLESY